MSSKVKVIENQSQTVLFECDLEDIEKAYQYALEMEGHGIDVSLQAPSLPESLALTLGMNESEIESLKQMLNDEIESHESICNDSCTYTLNSKDKLTH